MLVNTVMFAAAGCAVQAAGVNWDALEPFMDLGGVRIEDNVVITPGGHFNVTDATGLPKTAAGIEECITASRLN
jgi:hypothetical protein